MFNTFHCLFGRGLVVPWVALGLALGVSSLGAAAEPPLAQQFTADIVGHNTAGAAVGSNARIYVTNRRVRIELAGSHDEYFLIDGNVGSAFLVRPAQRVFMDAKQSTLLTQVFVPIDPRDPCRQWQAAVRNAGVTNDLGAIGGVGVGVGAGAGAGAGGGGGDWRCTRIDAEIVAGRTVINYKVVSADRKSSQRWIDPGLEFPVKMRAADGTTIALEHIREEAQPAGLFVVPSGYRKFDPQALIERIKHSDVWVDSPH
jgi:hypothetical protein